MEGSKYFLALFHAPGIGHKLFHVICNFLNYKQVEISEIFKSPDLFNQLISDQDKNKELESFCNGIRLLTEKKVQQFNRYLKTYNDSLIEKDLLWQDEGNQNILSYYDNDYPELLKQIDVPPPILYVLGEQQLLSRVQLAMVGSRNPTPSGKEIAFNFAHYLAQAGMVITSGLALGIDAASHQGCLAASGKTIAVAGTGLDRVYPAKHRDLAHDIANRGAIVSCFPLETGPTRGNFPKRNQIISGLSVGTLVVEAALQSGSLITARLAMEQGREVFAIPGSINNPLAKGCHALIRQGAKLVETADDIVEEIINLSVASQLSNEPGIETEEIAKPETVHPFSETNIENKTKGHGLSEQQQQLLAFIDTSPVSIDQLAERSHIAIKDITSLVLLLELQGKIQSLPGGKICRS